MKENKIFVNSLKNTFINVSVIGTFFALASYYINCKQKEDITMLYEMRFQQDVIKNSTEDVFGNIKEKKRISIFEEEKKRKFQNE